MDNPDIIEELEIKKKKPLWRKIIGFILKFGLAALIIGWIVRGNADKIVDNLKDFNYWWLIPALVLYISHMLICGWRWYMLLRVLKVNISLWEALCLTMKAYFCSLVIPGGAIGGDLAKVGFVSMRAPKGTKLEGAFTILIDRITGMIALFVTAIVLTLVSIPLLLKVDMPELYKFLSDLFNLENTDDIIHMFRILAIVAVLGLCLSGLAACVVIFMHKQFRKVSIINSLMDWVDVKSKGMLTRVCDSVDIYRDKKMLLFNMTVVSVFFIHLNLGAVMFFLLKGLGVTEIPIMAMLTAIILGNIAGLIPFTPSGIGFRDYTVIKILCAGGIIVDKAESSAILFTALVLCANLISGLFFFVNDGSVKRASDQSETERGA